jgi:alpha-L-rhamnosidase
MKQYFLTVTMTFLICFGLIAQIKPVKLTCEYMNNPTVVDVRQPRLSWVNIAGENDRGQAQTAWQVRVASKKDKLQSPDMWDSKRVQGNQSTRVVYNGQPLKSEQECWWQVRVWDKDDKVSEWSEPAVWHMGLLDASEWKATWIGAPWQGEEALPKPTNPGAPMPEQLPPPAPLLRKEFNVQKEIAEAKVYVTGLGYFELWLNGEKVGDDVLVPNQTNYGKRANLMQQNIPLPDDFRDYKVMYLAYDVKDRLKKGANAIGGIVGNGFYNPAKYWAEGYGTPRFLAQLHIIYTDGSKDIVVSDPTWKAAKSAILMDMVFYGEHYDARQDQPGWCTPGFNDSAWEHAVIRKAPEGRLIAHTAHPDKVMQRLKPVRIEKMYDGVYRVDFGVEVSGWIRLSDVEGPAGHKIEIKYLSNEYSGDNSYVFRGVGKEDYAARFNWFIFREVEVKNWPGVLHPEQITAEFVHTYVEESADFKTSNPLFNSINEIWKRSQVDNMHGGIASDCPHRERSAYTGDGQVACVTVMHNFDTRNFYHKWIHDIIDAQIVETGYVPNGAPWQPGCGGGVAWGAAISIMPWEFYLHYGSKDILEDSYPAMKEYIRYMQTWVGKDGIMHMQRPGRDGKVLKWFNLGEWVTPGNLPPDELVHTFYFWRCANITAKTAAVIGNTAEAKKYASLAESTRQSFHKRFFNAEKGTYGPAGGNIFALRMGVPENQYTRVINALKEDIKANDGHLDTGIFGTQFFFETLSENGMHDLAFEAMNKTTEPGYGRWLALGATTTWEHWDTGGSHNHPMFGGGLVWYYRKLAGMNADPEAPGYRHIIFRPEPVGDITYAEYYNETSYGRAGIYWKNENNEFNMAITVPVGSYATVFVPVGNNQKIFEGGSPVAGLPAIESAGEENGYKIFKVASGLYNFSVR